MSDVPNDRTLGTAGPQFFVQVPLAVGSGPDWTVVAWSDTRNGNLDNSTQNIATAVVDLAVETPGGYRSRDVAFGILGGVIFGAGLAMLLAVVGIRRSGEGTARPTPA